MLLITGATGFIGSHVIEKLCAAGIAARCVTRRAGAPPREGVEFVRADFNTGEGLEAALRDIDSVIHLAGVTKTIHREEYYAGNAGATGRLVRALAGRGVRLIHVSSLAAAGPATGRAAVDEDTVPRPVADYGRSKLEAEGIVRRGLPDAVIVRPPVVYGPRDTDVYQLLKSVSRGWAFEIGGGERWFSAIYVEDLADALVKLATGSAGAGRTYFLAHPKAVSWRGLADMAGRIMGVRPHHVRMPAVLARGVGLGADLWARATGKPGIVSRDKIAEALCDNWTCNPARAARELGWEAPTHFEAGLERTLAWYHSAGWLEY
jgi:nucleoside-diphosphate-sugar epimerase